jgi:DNA replication protein DnaC
MLTHPTLDKLHALRLMGMAKALQEQIDLPESQTLSFEERLGLLVDREMTERSDRRLTTRLRQAKLRLSACLEDLDYRHPRGLDKSLMLGLASCQWVKERHNVLITGPTGVGKTWVACALGHQACREGYSVLYRRLPRLLQELSIAKGDGRYPKLMTSLAKTAGLILDDWGLASLNDENRRDVLELLEDRHGRGATLVTSQFPVEHWHEALGNPTLADAILDRLLHNAYKMTLR